MQNWPFNKATSSSLQRNLNTSYFVLQTLSLHMLLTKAGREQLVSLESSKGRWKTHKGLKAELRQVPGSRDALILLWGSWLWTRKNQSRAVFSVVSTTIQTALVPKVRGPSSPPNPIHLLSPPLQTPLSRWWLTAWVISSPVKAISQFSSHVLYFLALLFPLWE